MNTDQKYEKITLTLPKTIIVSLQMIPKGNRSSFVARAIQERVGLQGLKKMAERLAQSQKPSQIREHKGRWRKRLPCHSYS